ncbi:MAG: hypothetical protein NT128_01110, partial [Proteobacteria bacterium]|nr:hypothetical protein [Pseudomonadota bacterium]
CIAYILHKGIIVKKLHLMLVGFFIIACPKSTYGAALPEDDSLKWINHPPFNPIILSRLQSVSKLKLALVIFLSGSRLCRTEP